MVAPDLYRCAASIAEYTDTSVFLPELTKEGTEAPPNWFGLILVDGEDSVEEIASSDEGEEEEDEDDKDDAPDDGDDGRPHPDQVSTNG